MKNIIICLSILTLLGCTTQKANKTKYCEAMRRITELVSPGMDIYEAHKILNNNGVKTGEVYSPTGHDNDMSISIRYGYRMSALDELSMAMEKDVPGSSDVPIRISIQADTNSRIQSIGSNWVKCN